MQKNNGQHALSDCNGQVCGYRSLYMLGTGLGMMFAVGVLFAVFH